MAELRTLKKAKETLDIYAISIDPPEKSKSFAEKIAADGKGNLGFLILSDPGSKTIDAWGLRDPAYKGQPIDGVPHPAVFVLDKSGKVAWSRIESDFKVRPTNAEIRKALDGLAK